MRACFVLFLALCVSLAAGCRSERPGPAGAPVARPAQAAADELPPGGEISQREPIPPRAWVRAATGPVLHLELTERGMEPARLEVPVYEQVRILVVNRTQSQHNLIIPDFRVVAKILGPGEENYIEFTADRKGDFPLISDSAEPDLRAILAVR